MAKQLINRGTNANDGTGDNLRTGANKVNLNFNEIYTAIGDGTTVDGTVKFADDTSTVSTISANGETLRVLGGTAITTTISGNNLTINADTSSLLSASGTATITNKTIDLTDNTLSGTFAEVNTMVSDATLVDTASSQALTNKNLTGAGNTFPTLSIKDDASTIDAVSLGQTLTFEGGTGITTTVTDNKVSYAAEVSAASTNTLTNKTISGADNTITNIAASNVTGAFDNTSSGSKIRFNFAGTSAFPNEATYEGMFAYDTTGNEAYVADSGGWTKLINENASVGALSNVNIVGVADGQALIWSSAQGRFNPGSVSAATELNVQEEGSALSTAADTLNFVGPGLTASGTGTTKTVTLDNRIYKGSYKTTAAHIDVTHNGSGNYLFNSHYSGANPTLHLSPGKTYAFHLDIAGHPFFLQTVSGAYSSGNPYNTGLTHVADDGTVTTGSNAQLKVSGILYVDTPQGYSNDIYYVCQYHSSMQGKIAMGHRFQTFTGDGTTTAFTLQYENRNSQDILVFVNGICLVPSSVDYSVSGSTLTFVTAPANTAEITIRYIQ